MTSSRFQQIPVWRRRLALLVLLCLVGLSGSALGSPASDPRDDDEIVMPVIGAGREAVAAPAEIRPVLDGNVLDDPAWRDADVITGFWQTTPDEGMPASERTEVRVLHTADTLYIGVVNYDRAAGRIVTTDARRDASLSETDSFLILLDTYWDRQSGFIFGTNPAGMQYDGQVRNDGDGSGSFNLDWDGDWDVRTRISDIGWSAEFAIPFRTLRYPARDVQTWGINFQRNIRRHNETAFWAPLPRQYNLRRVSLAGQLTGLEVPAQRSLQIMPYALSQARQRGSQAAGTSTLGDFGADMKFGLTPSLTLDVTYNTDFAHVEVDEQQINLDRFSLFFPEKRPFFLENAGLFRIGNAREAEVFFSRRIGIDRDGGAIPILGGARLTGQVGRTNVGFLNMQTEEVEGRQTPSNNFGLARVQHELPNRSAVGAMFVNRQATGRFAGADDHNRAYAVDGRWGVGANTLVSGWAARTSTPGLSGDAHAFGLSANYAAQALRLSGQYSEVGDSFNPEVGFLQRGGFRRANLGARYHFRPDWWRFHELRPHVTYRSYWTRDGFQESQFIHIDQHWELQAGHEFHTGMNLTREGVIEPFQIFPGVIVPPGTYDHKEAQLVGFTNQGAPLSGNLRVDAGGFFGGTRVQLRPSIRFRASDTFSADLSLNRNDITLPGGSFTTTLIGTRLSYSVTPRVLIQTLVQYNDRAQEWSTNLRFSWLHRANTGLFIVYNDTQGLADNSRLLRPDRSLTIKLSRLVNVFN